MKKRLFAMIIAMMAMCALLAMPVAAEDGKDLTDQHVSDDTEVDATIKDGAGEVAYIVTIPQKVDFGTLSCPSADEDSMAVKTFKVSCVKMQGVKNILVSVCDEDAVEGEKNQGFYLTNMSDATCTFKPSYDLYVGNSMTDNTKIDTSEVMPANGYKYVGFSKEGQSVGGGVSLNQRQLYPYRDTLADIAGSYTGKMIFTIAAQ